jgi:DNA-binding NarL/FixJ family response regulator
MNKVLLVDDHAFLRDALAMVMAREFPAAVVLQADTLQAARQTLSHHRDTDLVLLDLGLPDGSGMEALPGLRRLTDARIVVMSADGTAATVNAALEAGAAGFLPKTLTAEAMLAALTLVMQGGVFLPPAVMTGAHAPGQFGHSGHAPVPEAALPGLGLSARQVDVLRLLVEGASNKVIARALNISEATVKTHVGAIFARTGAGSRSQVVVLAARLGLRLPPQASLGA